MKRGLLLIIGIAFIFNSCNAQDRNEKQGKSSASKNIPKEDIKVNKEYDDEGNLILYDSTYTYYYSNIDKDKNLSDSIFNEYIGKFYDRYPFSDKSFFNDLFFQDSLLKYDFYKNDFFTERFKRNMEKSEEIFREMDSLKNKFFSEQFPEKK
jgi:hypothetical protein